MWVPVIKQLTLDLMRSRAGRTVPAVSIYQPSWEIICIYFSNVRLFLSFSHLSVDRGTG